MLSAVKNLDVRRTRFFAALRMTGASSLQSAHGASSLQMSVMSGCQFTNWHPVINPEDNFPGSFLGIEPTQKVALLD